jgi:hypothetical protein
MSKIMVAKTKVRIKGPNNNLGVVPILVEWGNCYVGQLGQNDSYSKEPNISFYFLKPNQNFLAFTIYAQGQVVKHQPSQNGFFALKVFGLMMFYLIL